MHLIHLIQKAINEIAGLPRLPRLPVPLDLLGDEDPKLREVSEDSVVRAREPVQDGGENVVHLGGRDLNRTSPHLELMIRKFSLKRSRSFRNSGS